MFQRFSSNKCKTQCKLCVGRIKLMRNKKQIMVKNMRKEIADLLRANKQENARIRVEAVIRENLLLQAYDILELFLELLSVRTQLVEKSKDIPPDMIEALSSLIYAAQRVQDFQELIIIRAQLGKFGKDYVTEASSDLTCRKWHVNENLIRCLAIDAPAPEDKLATLSDIAQEYGVEWDTHRAAADMLPSGPPSGPSPPMFPQGGPGVPPGPYGGGGGGGQGGDTRFPDVHGGAPRMLPGALATGKTLPDQVQAKAKEEWADAMSAAAAAAEHARRAQEASDAAGRYARAGSSAQVNGTGPKDEVASKPATAEADNSTATDDMVPPPLSNTAAVPKSPAAYFKRTDSEIQRAYDAAPGPPTKKDAQASGPPSAPPAPPPPTAQAPADTPSLPSPPAKGQTSNPGASAGAPAANAKPGNDLDDLQKRFEMLKRR